MLTRRAFLRLTGAAVAALSSPAMAVSQPAISWPLKMRRGKEGYMFDAATREGFAVARYLMRDIRGGNVQGLPHLSILQSLSQSQVWFAAYGVDTVFELTSGLRLPSTNAKTEGASKNSLHMPDKNGWFFAADVRPGTVDIEKAAGWFRLAGLRGIGIYPTDDFLHVDVGSLRSWRRG